jgi:hypothetical protein
MESGRVLIYTGADNSDVNELWKTISSEEKRGDLYKAVCQQLGYNDGRGIAGDGNDSEVAKYEFTV